MKTVSEETLMAFRDGELDAAAASEVLAAVEADAGLRARLDRMKEIDELLRAAVQTDLAVPDRFKNLLADGSAKQASNVLPFIRQKSWQSWIPTGVGIAAALLIVVSGNLMAPSSMAWLQQVEDGIALAGPVELAIVSAESGTSVHVKGLNVMPVVSFVSSDGRMCREAQLDDDEMAARIVACRDVSEDEWCIEAFARMPSMPHKNGYYAAGVPKDPVIDAAYARLGIRTTLTAQAEKAEIAAGWVQKQ